MQAIDPVFDAYQEVLFGESTMTFQRSVQTAEVNAQIDETVESFLQRLTPYCLLKPAHKALEWLIFRYKGAYQNWWKIHWKQIMLIFWLESTNLLIVPSVNKIVSFCLFRFNINIYNMDAFMVCLLPFHESKIFIRAVQLLNLKSKTATKWDWLLPIQVNIWFFFILNKFLHSFFIPLNRNLLFDVLISPTAVCLYYRPLVCTCPDRLWSTIVTQTLASSPFSVRDCTKQSK